MSTDIRKNQRTKAQQSEDVVEEAQGAGTPDGGDVSAAGDHHGSSEPAR